MPRLPHLRARHGANVMTARDSHFSRRRIWREFERHAAEYASRRTRTKAMGSSCRGAKLSVARGLLAHCLSRLALLSDDSPKRARFGPRLGSQPSAFQRPTLSACSTLLGPREGW
jgi:hypothetical protein